MSEELIWIVVALSAVALLGLWRRRSEQKRQERQSQDFLNMTLGVGWEKRVEEFERDTIEFAQWQRQELVREIQEQQRRDNVARLKSQGLIKDDPPA